MREFGPDAKPYPCFSPDEMARRHQGVATVLEDLGASAAVVCGIHRHGSAVGWLTGWPVTREAMVLVQPGEQDVLLVQFYNHVPAARRIAVDAEVRWGGPSTAETMAELLRRRGVRRALTIGPMTSAWHALLSGVTALAAGDRSYSRLRMVKSQEEINFLRFGVRMSDAGMAALHTAARPGADERMLGAAVEAAYLAEGGTNHIHYFGVTAMDSPSLCVPAQYPSTRRVRSGDVVMAEISASFWDYPGQILRTFAVDAEPTHLFEELHGVAEAVFDRIVAALRPGATCWDVVDAASVIEDAGFTVHDDLLHGFVGGYLPPVLGTLSRTLDEIPHLAFQAGMTVVVQPNVITADERAGVQTGELVLVGEDGAERLHSFPRGLLGAPSG